MPRSVWDDIIGQPRVVGFLRGVIETGTVSHAYLFVGMPGAGKKTTARSFACALFCGDCCGTCGACTRVKRGTHPDVHIIEPEGAGGYVAAQVRELVRDVNLAPIEGPRKVYIIESADSFNDASANALLKTLEEPPADVVFILLAHAVDLVPPTIVSRCQVVRFRRLAPSAAIRELVAISGAGEEEAAIALAAAGGVIVRARDFLASPGRRVARMRILRALDDLPTGDDLDVLTAAKELLAAVKAPLEEVRTAQASELAERAEFLGKAQAKGLEERHKRELTAREREGIAEILNVAESWLRDCLTLSQGVEDLAINTDALDAMQDIGRMITPAAATRALRAVNVARRRISYNVSPQLAIEAMLFDIREVLRCPR